MQLSRTTSDQVATVPELIQSEKSYKIDNKQDVLTEQNYGREKNNFTCLL